MKSLKALVMEREQLRPSDIRALPLVLRLLPELVALDLSCNDVGPEWVRVLAEAIFATTNDLDQTEFSQLVMQFCGLKSLSGLAAALDCTTNTGSAGMTALNFAGNRLGPKAMEDLYPVAKSAPKLKSLILEKNPLGPDGAFALVSAIRATPELEVLRLGECSIGPDGAADLADGLRELRSLQELGLECNGIGSEGARALVEALQRLEELTSLDVSWNSLGQSGVQQIAVALRYCRRMGRLLVVGNGLDPAAERELSRGVRQIATGVLEPTRGLLRL